MSGLRLWRDSDHLDRQPPSRDGIEFRIAVVALLVACGATEGEVEAAYVHFRAMPSTGIDDIARDARTALATVRRGG